MSTECVCNRQNFMQSAHMCALYCTHPFPLAHSPMRNGRSWSKTVESSVRSSRMSDGIEMKWKKNKIQISNSNSSFVRFAFFFLVLMMLLLMWLSLPLLLLPRPLYAGYYYFIYSTHIIISMTSGFCQTQKKREEERKRIFFALEMWNWCSEAGNGNGYTQPAIWLPNNRTAITTEIGTSAANAIFQCWCSINRPVYAVCVRYRSATFIPPIPSHPQGVISLQWATKLKHSMNAEREIGCVVCDGYFGICKYFVIWSELGKDNCKCRRCYDGVYWFDRTKKFTSQPTSARTHTR